MVPVASGGGGGGGGGGGVTGGESSDGRKSGEHRHRARDPTSGSTVSGSECFCSHLGLPVTFSPSYSCQPFPFHSTFLFTGS